MTAKNRFSMPFILDLEPAAEKIFRAIEKRRTIYAFPWQIAFITRFLGLLPRVIRDRLLKIPGFI
jgi:hypothetical protein